MLIETTILIAAAWYVAGGCWLLTHSIEAGVDVLYHGPPGPNTLTIDQP